VLLIAALLLITVACDQASKAAARRYLEPAAPLHALNGTVTLALTSNTGAFLGLGASLPERARLTLLVGLVGLALGAGLWSLLRATGLSWWVLTAGTLLVGGGTSNLVDRLTHQGCVTDFLVLGLGPLRTGVFNAADVAIMAGLVLMLGSTLRRRGTAHDET